MLVNRSYKYPSKSFQIHTNLKPTLSSRERKMVIVTPVFDHHHSQSQHIQEQLTNSTLRPGKLLHLEKYLEYVQSQDFASLTVEQLKMIVSIHGFKKPDKRKDSEEMVRGIDPINPVRSTLQGNISSSIKATITLNEVIRDLKSLNWQECSITSIKTINQQSKGIITELPSMRVTKTRTRRSKKNKKTAEIASSMSCSSSGPSSNNSSSKNHLLALALPVKTESLKGFQKPMLKKRRCANVNELA